MNYCVKLIDQLPYALTEEITINITEAWMMYLLIILALTFLDFKQIKYLHLTLFTLISLLSFQLYEIIIQSKQHKLVVYSVPKTTVIDFISGQQNFLLSSDEFITDDNKLLFYVKHNWWEIGVEQHHFYNFQDTVSEKMITKQGEKCYTFRDKKMMITNQFPTNELPPIAIDYLIIPFSRNINWENLTANYKPQKIIIDSSVPKWKAEKWKQITDKLKLPCYYVSLEGAFIDNI